MRHAASALLALVSLAACAGGASVARVGGVFELGPAPRGLDEFVPVPEANPLTAAGVALGERLFFDPVLSLDSSRACGSCHMPDRAFSDSVPVSRGVGGRSTKRNAPSLMNRAYGAAFFWDGRTTSLEATVLLPIENEAELALPLAQLVDRLQRNGPYRAVFARAFPGQSIAAATIARALASYVRTLRAGNSPADRFALGDSVALSAEARRGRRLFLGAANCSTCHLGPNFTDERFHNTGVSFDSGDVGRYALTGDSADLGRFKVPTLRNAARTAPYMHDGSIATLEDVVAFYNRGHPNPRLDREIRPLGLSAAEQRDLVAFLRALTGP